MLFYLLCVLPFLFVFYYFNDPLKCKACRRRDAYRVINKVDENSVEYIWQCRYCGHSYTQRCDPPMGIWKFVSKGCKVIAKKLGR